MRKSRNHLIGAALFVGLLSILIAAPSKSVATKNSTQVNAGNAGTSPTVLASSEVTAGAALINPDCKNQAYYPDGWVGWCDRCAGGKTASECSENNSDSTRPLCRKGCRAICFDGTTPGC